MPRPMNKATLDVVIAVQRFQKLALAETHIFPDRQDWFARTEAYYLSLPVAYVREAGLHRNRYDFERIISDFKVTDPMGRCLYEDLHYFDFDRCYGPEENPVPKRVAEPA